MADAGGFGPQFISGVEAVDQHAQFIAIVVELDPGVESAADQGRMVVQVDPLPPGGHPDRPVQGPGVQVVPAQALGHEAADGALAGTGRAVDGEYGNGVGHEAIMKGGPNRCGQLENTAHHGTCLIRPMLRNLATGTPACRPSERNHLIRQ
jgi:hypothetical protein